MGGSLNCHHFLCPHTRDRDALSATAMALEEMVHLVQSLAEPSGSLPNLFLGTGAKAGQWEPGHEG